MKTKASRALKEVWEMKQAAYEETKHLSGVAYFKHIHERVTRMIPGIEYRSVRARTAAVAEERVEYMTRKKGSIVSRNG
jgi:hypothetical protein